jgi:putative membrane protein
MSCCGGGMLMVFWWISLIVALVVGAVLVTRHLWDRANDPRRGVMDENALRALEERYARGDIDREEFEERRRELGDARSRKRRGG